MDRIAALKAFLSENSSRILLYLAGISVAWISVVVPAATSFEEVVSIHSARYGEYHDATNFMSDLKNTVYARALREWRDACTSSYQAAKTPTFINSPVEELQGFCRPKPQNTSWDFESFASETEKDAYAVANEEIAAYKTKLSDLHSLANVDLLGTKISFPKLWGPVVLLACALAVLNIVARLQDRLAKANRIGSSIDPADPAIDDLRDFSLVSVGKRLGAVVIYPSLVLLLASSLLAVMVITTAYFGFRFSGFSWQVRIAAGFGDKADVYKVALYRGVIALLAIACLIRIVSVFTAVVEARAASDPGLDASKRWLIGFAVSAPVIAYTMFVARWPSMPTKRYRPARTFFKIPDSGLQPGLHADYHGAGRLYYVSGKGTLYGRSTKDPRFLARLKPYHGAFPESERSQIDQIAAPGAANIRSSILEQVALDRLEAGDVAKALETLDTAIAFDLTKGLSPGRRISVRLLDLRATITVRNLAEEELRAFADRVENILSVYAWRADPVDQRRIATRLTKWRSEPFTDPGPEQQGWVTRTKAAEHVVWLYPQGRTREDARAVIL